MKYNPDIHQRKSYRLRGYDYSQEGLYFITICTYQKECIFGEIHDGIMSVNEFGEIVESEIINTSKIRNNIKIHNHVIMPNHIHFIIEVLNNEPNVGAYRHTPDKQHNMKNNFTQKDVYQYVPTTLKSPSQTIGAVVRAIKSSVTSRINQLRNSPQQPVWQRNYYDNIIRNEKIYLKVLDYIDTNPLKWNEDKYNKLNTL